MKRLISSHARNVSTKQKSLNQEWSCAVRQLLYCLLLIYPAAGIAASDDKPKPVDVIGTVEVSNLPGTQDISGVVSVDNLPAIQQVSGSVSVTNLSTDPQQVVIDQSAGEPVHVVGPVDVVTMPDVTVSEFSSTARLEVRLVDGAEIYVNNLDELSPVLVRGGEDVITPTGTGKEVFSLAPNVVMTDLVVFNAGDYLDCLVEIGQQYSHGWVPFFSFIPDKGLNQISLASGIIPTGAADHITLRVGNEAGQCGASLLWTGYEMSP